ncbi:MFS transporter [Actinokineospora sp.]|uniref:MFS transporter n=1 Tax=Actinokineospora sp. TaxID=1872133 RepID=UPI0040381BCC
MRHWLILGLSSLSMLILAFNGTAANVALPDFASTLGASTDQLQWIIVAYSIAGGSILLIAGLVGDRWGHKTTLVWGLAIFAAAALVGVFASSADTLIVVRAVMGIGGAIVAPMTLAIIRTSLPASVQGRAVAVWTGSTALGMPLGPIAGGYLVDQFGWAAIFLTSGLAAGLALLGFAALVQQAPVGGHAVRIDFAGTVLVSVVIVAMAYSVITVGRGQLTSTTVLAACVGIASVIGLRLWRRRADRHARWSPLRNPGFRWACTTIFLLFFSVMGILFLAPVYFQVVIGFSATESGLVIVPLALSLLLASLVSGKVADRYSVRGVVACGLGLLTVGLISLSFLSWHAGLWLTVLSLGLIGIGVGLAQTPATNLAMAVLRPEDAGLGSALITMFRHVGSVMGVGIIGSLANLAYNAKVSADIGGLAIDPDATSSVSDAMTVADRIGGQTGAVLRTGAATAYTEAIGIVALSCAVVTLVAATLAVRYLPAAGRRHSMTI